MKEKDLEKIFKALANRRRIAIIRFLKKQKEASVGEIAEEIELSFKATSKHLNILATADFLEKEQKSLQMLYRLNADSLKFMHHLVAIL